MNCQITKIKSDILSFDIVSSKIDQNYKLGSIILIDRINFIESENEKVAKNQIKSFGKIAELSSKSLKLKLFKPKLFRLGKIIKLNLVKEEYFFLPHILNKVIVFGDVFNFDNEKSFEFIPTVLLSENVLQGQKIGYINAQTTAKHNFKYWILAHQSGKVNKIQLGDFKLGEQIATIGKSNIILGNQKRDIQTGGILLNTNLHPKSISLQEFNNFENKYNLHIKTGTSNLILDVNKKFLNSFFINTQQLENYILIFVTEDINFAASSEYKTITFLDQYNLGVGTEITNLALSICEIGYSVMIISQKNLNLKCIGQYKTINGEDVNITLVVQDSQLNTNLDHFENIITID